MKRTNHQREKNLRKIRAKFSYTVAYTISTLVENNTDPLVRGWVTELFAKIVATDEKRRKRSQRLKENQKRWFEKRKGTVQIEGKKLCTRCRCVFQLPEFADGERSRSSCRRCTVRCRTYGLERYKTRRDELRQRQRDSINVQIGSSKKSARKRNIPYRITDEFARKTMRNPCVYCGHMSKRGFVGLDRIDNRLGYEETNLVAACEWCNLAKMTSDPVSFFEQVFHIASFVHDGKTPYPNSFGTPMKLTHLYKCRTNGQKKGLTCTLTKDDFVWLAKQTCVFTGLLATSWDRIDNAKGYTRDNVQPVTAACNYMRGNRTVDEFLDHCVQIVDHMQRSGALDAFRAMNVPRIRDKKRSMNRTCDLDPNPSNDPVFVPNDSTDDTCELGTILGSVSSFSESNAPDPKRVRTIPRTRYRASSPCA